MENNEQLFNPGEWIERQETENPVLKLAESLVANARNGEKHHQLCKASFLLGGYVGGNILSESEAIRCLKNAISKKDHVKNLRHAFKTIEKCLNAGKSRPILNGHAARLGDNFQHFKYSDFQNGETTQKVDPEMPLFPIEVFPRPVQQLIMEAKSTVGFPVNYLASSMLFAVSAMIGNTCKLKVRSTQHEATLLFMALVGPPGVNKSHPLRFALMPLFELEKRFSEAYHSARQIYEAEMEEYERQKPQDRIAFSKPEEPVQQQILVSDTTFEALFALLSQNMKGMGLYRDELRGLMKDLNKYRKGSDLEQLLSIWNCSPIKLNRKTDSGSIFISDPYLPIIGTIQSEIMIEAFQGESLKNGLTDRFLFSFSEDERKLYYSDAELPAEQVEKYKEMMFTLYEIRDRSTFNLYTCSPEAKELFKSWHNENADRINEEKSVYIKGVYSKMESYISRFALILELMSIAMGEQSHFQVHRISLEGAIQLAEYFSKTAIHVRTLMNCQNQEINPGGIARFLYKRGKSLREIGDILDISHTQAGKIIKE